MPDPTKGQGSSRSGRGEMSAKDRAAFERRIEALDDKLDKVAPPHDSAGRAGSGARRSGRGMAYGLRMASELVAAVLVGGLIGYGLDAWLGTKPWLFLVLFMVGFAAGIMNLLRAYRRLQAEINAETGGYLGEKIADDDD